MCRRGKNLTCINKLHSENIVNKEIPRVLYSETVSSKENAVEFHSNEISETTITGIYFITTMKFDLIFKIEEDNKRKKFFFLKLKDGKINSVHFFSYNLNSIF